MIPEKSFLIVGHICLNVTHVRNFNGKAKLRKDKNLTCTEYLITLKDTVSSSLIMMAIAVAYTGDRQRQGREIFPT